MDFSSIIQTVSVFALPLVVAITLHEAAHGFAANALGDDTAKREGRLSLNPIRHIDPIGTIVVPGILLFLGSFLFGWAKPVPVAFHRLRNPRYGMVLVALAGPMANLLLAILAVLLLHLAHLAPEFSRVWLVQNLANAVFVNVLLMVFNLIPIPPLDGGRVMVGLLPRQLAFPLARIEPVGILILLGLLWLLPNITAPLGFRIDPFAQVLQPIMNGVMVLLLAVFG